MPTNSKNYWSKNGGANYKKYHGTPSAIKDRVARTKARKEAVKEGRIAKGSTKELDHKKPLSKGGSTSRWNTRVLSRKKNRQLGAKLANKAKGSGYKKNK